MKRPVTYEKAMLQAVLAILRYLIHRDNPSYAQAIHALSYGEETLKGFD